MTWQELNRKQMDPVQASGRRALEQQMVALRRPSIEWGAPLAPALLESELDLGPYVNTSAFVAQDSLSLERAYILFRSMVRRGRSCPQGVRGEARGVVWWGAG